MSLPDAAVGERAVYGNYLPPEDVRTELLQPSDTTTGCPCKGIAHYWSLRVGQRFKPDIVRSYPKAAPRRRRRARAAVLRRGAGGTRRERGRTTTLTP